MDEEKDILRWFEQYVSPGKYRAYKLLELDFIPGKREGCRIWDKEGKKSYINCRASGGVFNLGHRPAVIIKALKEALEFLDIGRPSSDE